MTEYLFDPELCQDLLAWLKRRNSFPLNPKKSELDELQAEIITSNNSAFAYHFAHDFSYRTYKMQNIILANRDPKYSVLFAQNIKNCDINSLQKIVINSKNIKFITRFACFVKNCDKALLEKLIIKSNNAKYVHMYLKHGKPKNINKLKKIIINSNKPKYLFELAKHITSQKEFDIIEDLIIKSKSYTYIRLLAAKSKLANVEKLENVILTSTESEIRKFAKSVKKSKMRKFLFL